MSAFGTKRTSPSAQLMSASLIGRLGSSAFRLSTTGGADVTRGLVLLFGIGAKALPSWGSKTRWNDLRGGLADNCRQVQAHMRTDLIHRPARDTIPPPGGVRVPPMRFNLSGLSCGGFPGPAELGAIKPNAVHNPRQPPRQGDDRLFHAAAPGDLHRPSLEPRPFLRTQHALSCFVEHDPHHLISAA